jgi:hypothetical protein
MRKIVALLIAILVGAASGVAAYRCAIAKWATADRSHHSRSDFDTGF